MDLFGSVSWQAAKEKERERDVANVETDGERMVERGKEMIGWICTVE